MKFRRSLYFVMPLKAGDVISADAIRSVRPGYGLAPKFTHRVIGKKTTRDVEAFTPVSLDLVE